MPSFRPGSSSLPVAFLLVLAISCGRREPSEAPPLLVHVGGTMRPAMEEICRLFEAETGTKVELNYNDSGAITVIETTGKGDACVIHDPFGGAVEKRGFADRRRVPATLTPGDRGPEGEPEGRGAHSRTSRATT